MSIDRLRYFAAVVETKNLRKAAKMIGISPPSISKAISVLEAEIGAALLYSEGRGIGITPRGLEIYRLSASLLHANRQFWSDVKSLGTSNSSLRIATFEVFSTYFLASFCRQEPAIDLTILEMVPGEIERALIEDTIDLGLTYIPSPDPILEYCEIGAFEMGIFGQKEWGKKPFAEWPFAIPTTEMSIHSSEILSLDLWPQNAPKRKVKYHFELLETALLTSRRGLSVLHCPDFIAHLHNVDLKPDFQLKNLPIPTGYKRIKPSKMYLVARKGSPHLKLEPKLAKLARSFKLGP